MDAVLLTWRWQNVLTIWLMVVALALLVTVGAQGWRMINSNGSGNAGS